MTPEELALKQSEIAGIEMTAIGCLAFVFAEHMGDRGKLALVDLEKLYRLMAEKKDPGVQKLMFTQFADVIQQMQSDPREA